MCCGDFNEILHPDEKRGGNDRNVNLINEFREVLRDCGLKDVGFRGMLLLGIMEDMGRVLWKKGWTDLFALKLGVTDLWTVQQVIWTPGLRIIVPC